MMNDTQIFRSFKINETGKIKYFATELFDPPHTATACLYVGIRFLSLDTVVSCPL